MMASFHIFRIRLIEFLGSWKIILVLIVLPLFFVYLVGSVYSEKNTQTKNVTIFVDEDNSYESRKLISMINAEPLVDVIVSDQADAMEKLANMRAQNVYIIASGFGDEIRADKIPVIKKYSSKGLHAGATQFNLMAAGYRLLAEERTGKLLAVDYEEKGLITPEQKEEFITEVKKHTEEYWKREIPFKLDTTTILFTGEKTDTSQIVIGYLGLPTGMILTFMALFLGFGIVFIIHDSECGLLGRITVIAGEKAYLSGNLAAMLTAALICTLYTTAMADYLFGIQPQCSYTCLAVIFACYGLTLVTALAWLSLLVRNAAAMYCITAPMIIFLSFLGGCFFSIDVLPASKRFFTWLSPQGLAIQAITYASKEKIMDSLLICGIMLLIAFIFYLMILHRLKNYQQ